MSKETELLYAKGHGTGNDFLIIPDENEEIDLSPQRVARLADRHRGLGADGILRVVRRNDVWFMDYRNADGSLAEMCGNGVRVFAHWLYSRGLVDTAAFTVDTRAGLRVVEVREATARRAVVSVDMGPVRVEGLSTARMGERSFAGLGINVGNPHLAAVIPNLDTRGLADWPLGQPEWDHDFFPQGVNVEVLTPLIDGAVDMRVWERGVGETLSCGTGTVAAATAALADAGRTTGEVTVRVPGGEVTVTLGEESATLTGPSEIVAEGTTWL
ncbi:diaminopimelate epimerase [Corynebacterium oculi]|uniref:Diaminopimelate epimerase n=1 Tax=Corynebacterium oculi TaxID=1544416 RepID=A0A0Q0U128_9CORY|nr:diaminopimelate epimerase [Corynebacterium oculi]KQB85406.1 Diaminopimelate epimerase [Corynebacterium oculi]